MSKKTYGKRGYKIEYKKFLYIFNLPLESGYDWYISSNSCEKDEAVGVKRNDRNRTVSTVKSLNMIRAKLKLY